MSGLYTFYLQQSIGLPALPLVRPGDRVRRGARIAAKPEGLGANLHTSVTGTVERVTGGEIIIREEGTDFSSYLPLAGKTPWELVEEAGLVGLGGAGFPTAAKLKTPLGRDGVIILNAAECEPILCHNLARIEERPEALTEALALLLELTGAGRGIIALKGSHQAAVSRLESLNRKGAYEILPLPDIYPAGEERAVVREALGVLLPTDALPAGAGAVVLNAETALRLREAVLLRKPLIDKDLTVAGKLRKNGEIRVLKDVPVGMSVSEAFALAGGLGEGWGELILGGPFTGRRTGGNDAVRKTTGGLIATEDFLPFRGRLGLLVCACGGEEARLRELAGRMGAQVCGVETCKQAVPRGGGLKCENPGRCPGQAARVLALRKAGAEALLISNCTDCTNTVMSCAPQLGLKVFHCTDHALRAVNARLIRKLKQAL